MMRALVGTWRREGEPEEGTPVLLRMAVNRRDGRAVLAVCEPSLERESGEVLATLVLLPAEASDLVTRLRRGLASARPRRRPGRGRRAGRGTPTGHRFPAAS